MVLEPTDRIGDCSLYLSDCLQVLRQLPENSLEACVTDPPAGISFMNKAFDTFRDRAAFITWLTEIMAEVYRVLKPGAHALVWALPRTSHWTAMACEDAGFEVRDSILHIFSSGYPKSQNIAKAIDQHLNADPVVIGYRDTGIGNGGTGNNFLTEASRQRLVPVTAPATDAAKQWDGYGSALSPSHETWWLCRKPLSEPTLAQNVLRWGVGGINVDATRIPMQQTDREQYLATRASFARKAGEKGTGWKNSSPIQSFDEQVANSEKGRWPKNTILDGSDTVAAQFPDAPGQLAPNGMEPYRSGNVYGAPSGNRRGSVPRNETETSAARFYYAAKASKADRGAYNSHPTCKNTALMQYLIRLITPAGGTILDPFAGSGSTGKAALLEGKKFLGIEREAEYYAIMVRRLQEAAAQPMLFP